VLSASRHWLLALLPLSLAVAARARSRSPRAGRRLGASLTRAGCRQRRARLAGRRPPPPCAGAGPAACHRSLRRASHRRPVPLSAGARGPVAPTPGCRDTQLVASFLPPRTHCPHRNAVCSQAERARPQSHKSQTDTPIASRVPPPVAWRAWRGGPRGVRLHAMKLRNMGSFHRMNHVRFGADLSAMSHSMRATRSRG